MKRFLVLPTLFLFFSISFAQTQQGIVKTRGRMVNGQLVSGVRLSGATITLNIGNPLVSGNNGAFSFNVPLGKNFSLVTAQKQGYTLADPEYTNRSFAYSGKNPFYVVLEDEAQRQADVNAATRKVRRTLTAQLQAREDEIEALKEQNKLTEAEYQRRLQELYDNQSKSEQLVKEMAERYASTDYDQLDEFNRQVQMLIEEGELQKADSLIRSKGSFDERVANIQKSENANRLREQEIRNQQAELTQSKLFTAKEKESLSTDLYRASLIAQQQYQWDEAVSCLKMRADLDTTNASWNYDAALILSQQSYWLQSFDYYERALKHVQGYLTKTNVLNSYGYALWRHGEMDRAREIYLETLSCDPRLNPNDSRYSDDALAFHYTSMAVSSINNEDFGKYAKLALELYRKLSDCYYIAMNCNNVGLYYVRKGDLQKGLEYYIEAYSLDKVLHNDQPSNESFLSSLAWMEWTLGKTYLQIDSLQKANDFLSVSRLHYEQLAKKDLNQYRVHLVDVDNSLLALYSAVSKIDSIIVCRERLNNNLKILYERDPIKYEDYYNNMRSLLHLQGKTQECVRFSKELLTEYETPTGKSLYTTNNAPHAIRAHLREHSIKGNQILDLGYFINRLERLNVTDTLEASDIDWYMLGDAYYDLYKIYEDIGDLRTSSIYGEQSLQVLARMSNNIAPTANMYKELVQLYWGMGNYEKFDLYLEKALSLYTDLCSSNSSIYINDVIELQNRKVARLMINGKVDEALKLAETTFAMDESIAQSKEYLAECYNEKAYEYANNSDFNSAHASIEKAIALVSSEADFFDSKGEILLMQGRNDEALAMWKKVLELNPDFLDDYPDGTELSNGLKKLGLIE